MKISLTFRFSNMLLYLGIIKPGLVFLVMPRRKPVSPEAMGV